MSPDDTKAVLTRGTSSEQVEKANSAVSAGSAIADLDRRDLGTLLAGHA